MNHHSKFDAASFILGGEIGNRTKTHTQTNREIGEIGNRTKTHTQTNSNRLSTPCLSACVDKKLIDLYKVTTGWCTAAQLYGLRGFSELRPREVARPVQHHSRNWPSNRTIFMNEKVCEDCRIYNRILCQNVRLTFSAYRPTQRQQLFSTQLQYIWDSYKSRIRIFVRRNIVH